MELVLSTNGFSGRGGSESYLATVAYQLLRLGHGVTLHANEFGSGLADQAVLEGLRVAQGPHGLPDSCDGILVQDGICAYQLAQRYAAVPQLFVAHSVVHDLQLPPQLPEVVAGAVALNDRVAERLEALALAPAITRLRQPVDLDVFFVPNRPLPDVPRRVLALGNRLPPARVALLREVCAERGLELEVAGERGVPTLDPAERIADADIVVGYGRCIVEAMSMGRAAYVWDHLGGDGWVTPQSYAALEARGFAGHGNLDIVDAERLRSDFDHYSPSMGQLNRDLADLHHGAARHAQALVRLLREAGAPERERAPLDELSRLTLLQWRTEAREFILAREVERLRAEMLNAEEREREVRELSRHLAALKSTRRYRLAALIGGLADRARACIARTQR